MKKMRIHVIPLTEHAMALLEMIKPLSSHTESIFSHLTEILKLIVTVNMALKRMGFAGRLVSHGLRSLASTTLNDQGFDSDIIEAAIGSLSVTGFKGLKIAAGE